MKIGTGWPRFADDREDWRAGGGKDGIARSKSQTECVGNTCKYRLVRADASESMSALRMVFGLSENNQMALTASSDLSADRPRTLQVDKMDRRCGALDCANTR